MKELNIVITSGGTIEPIDKVRKITNNSSGRLGSLIADKLLENKLVKITYICTRKSIKPTMVNFTNNLKIVEIETVNDLKTTVEKLLKEERVDYFIHAMAVSDYYVDYVSTANILTENFKNTNDIKNEILNPTNKLDNSSKLSSEEDNLIVVLKKSPKIINLIKKISPNTKLIGFKLLENVSKEELINVAIKLKDKNNCDYVVANDLSKISKDFHEAFIINKENTYKKVFTKNEIAENINKIIF